MGKKSEVAAISGDRLACGVTITEGALQDKQGWVPKDDIELAEYMLPKRSGFQSRRRRGDWRGRSGCLIDTKDVIREYKKTKGTSHTGCIVIVRFEEKV